MPDFVYELIFEAEASKDADDQAHHDEHKGDFATGCCSTQSSDCPDFRQYEIIAKEAATTMTEMAMPDIWAFDSVAKKDEYAEALNTEIYEVLAVEILEDPEIAEYITGILSAFERADEIGEQLDAEIAPAEKDDEDKLLLDCSSVPDELPQGLNIEDIFEAVDANNSGQIDEAEGRAAMACAAEKGWITAEEETEIFDYFAGHAGEDDLDIEEAKKAFEKIHEITDFDFGLE